MTPLQQVATGLLLVALDSSTPWDVLPDPVGWLLIVPALAHLPDAVRRPPQAAALVAGVVSALAWPPAGRGLVDDLGEPSVDWLVLFLPDLVFAVLLCRALSRLAKDDPAGNRPDPDDPDRARRSARESAGLLTLMVLIGVGALAPVPFLATDRPIPGDFEILTQLCWLVLLGLLFGWHRRPWAPVRGASA